MAFAKIPRCFSEAENSGALIPVPETSNTRMFVCTSSKLIRTPGSSARASASRRAFRWSRTSSGGCFSSATSPAAASTPACRMPPPSILRKTRAFSMKAREPTTSEPTGAPNPFDRQNIRESTLRVISATLRPR